MKHPDKQFPLREGGYKPLPRTDLVVSTLFAVVGLLGVVFGLIKYLIS